MHTHPTPSEAPQVRTPTHPHVPRHAGVACRIVHRDESLPLLHSTGKLSGDAEPLHFHLRGRHGEVCQCRTREASR